MFRNDLPNNTKHNASSIVDLPEPFAPTISVVPFSDKLISVLKFPVERKFLNLSLLKVIILYFQLKVLRHIVRALASLIY